MLSFVLGILSFYQKDDQHLRIMMVVMNLNHALHFALLGATTACLSALLSVVRTGLSITTRSHIVAYLFIAITLFGILGILEIPRKFKSTNEFKRIWTLQEPWIFTITCLICT